MSVEVKTVGEAGIELNILGKLAAVDYRRLRELTDRQIERTGKVNLLLVIKDFAGWTPAALWEDLKFDVAYYNDVARLAIVGEDPSQHWVSVIAKPFTAAEVKYYLVDDIEMARDWIGQLPQH